MDAPPIQYARTEDGGNIAYWTLGERSNPALMIVPWGVGHLTAEWEIEPFQAWFERLSSTFFLVAFDARGSGLSQRDIADFSLARYASDIGVVAAQVGLNRYSLLTIGWGAMPSIVHAADHPEVVSHLVLWNPVMSGSAYAENRPLLMPNFGTFRKLLASMWTEFSDTNLAKDLGAMLNEAVTGDQWQAIEGSASTWEFREELSRVRAKTLVFGVNDLQYSPLSHAQDAAAALPDARLIVAADSVGFPQLGDAEAYAHNIEAFVGAANSRPTAEPAEADRPAPQNVDGLTPRELEVLSLVVDGRPNAAIAETLTLSPATVTRHVSNLLSKTGLSNRTELGRYATDRGLAGSP